MEEPKHRNYFIFVKIGEKNHIDKLQKNGKLYCNNIQYFRDLKDDELRTDKNEGSAYLKQVRDIQIVSEGRIIATATQAQFYAKHPDDKGNIFCLYGVETELVDLSKKGNQKINIERSVNEFGKSALLILDPSEFILRVKRELKRLSLEYTISPVFYFDPETYEGELSPFFKSKKFENQNEVRIWIANKEPGPIELNIGSIEDISHQITVDELDKIEVEVPEELKTLF